MNNFSEKLQTRVTEFKKNVDAAATTQKEQIAQRVQAARQKAEKSKAEIEQKMAANKSEFQRKLDDIKAKVEAKKREIRGKVDHTKAEFKAHKAQWDAEDAEDYAADTLAVAFFYIDEAEAAIIEAIGARATAESLKA